MNTSGRSKLGICDRIKRLDILAPEIGFSVQGNSGVKSFVGVLVSFIAVGFFIGASVYSIIQSLGTSQPLVVQQTSNSNIYPKMDLLKDKKFPAIMLYSESVGAIAVDDIPRYATIVAVKLTRKFTNNDPNSPRISTRESIPMVPCKNLNSTELVKIGAPTTPIEENVFNKNALCPDLSKTTIDLTVSGQKSDQVTEDIFLAVFPCVPSLSKKGCSTLAQLADVSVLPLFNLVNMDLSNFEKPISRAYNTDQELAINPSFIQVVTARLKMVEVWNSNGMFTEDTLVMSQSDFATQRSQFQMRSPTQLTCAAIDSTCIPYIRFQFSSGGTKETFIRAYRGILEIVGDVGGIRDIAFSVGLCLYIVYNSRQVRKRLIKSVFDIDSSNPKVSATDGQLLRPQSQRGCCRKRKNSVSFSIASKLEYAKDAPNEFDEDEAYEQIEKQLDIVNLIRKLNFIEVLLKFLRIEDDQQMNCVNQASYSLGKKGTQSAMAGQRIVAVGAAINELSRTKPSDLDWPEVPGKLTLLPHAQFMRGLRSQQQPVKPNSEYLSLDQPLIGHKPRDDLVKELVTFISAQCSWADKYQHPEEVPPVEEKQAASLLASKLVGADSTNIGSRKRILRPAA